MPPCIISTALRALSPYSLFNNTCSFRVPLALPLPFPCCLPHFIPVLCCQLFPLPILCSLPVRGSVLTALRVLVTLGVFIVIAIARLAPSSARCSGICPVLNFIILVNHLIPNQWYNGQEDAWFVLLAAWRLNLCPEIIGSVSREMLPGAFNLPQAGCLQFGAINLIPEGMGVVPPPIIQLGPGFVKHLLHI